MTKDISAMAELTAKELQQREAMIARQHNGIHPTYEAFYIQSIIYSAERSEVAFQRYEVIKTDHETPALIVGVVQEALAHAGALSRFFWPTGRKNDLTVSRGRRLRDAFNISDSSPLKSRKLRNAFEHFDEELDRFLLHDRVGYFFPGPLVNDHKLSGEVASHIFKLVDPKRGVCVLLGETFEFHPIRREVQHILSMAMEKDRNGGRL